MSHIRIASDVGGTFTDSLAYDSQRRTLAVSKVATTPDNRALGTVAGLRLALERVGGEAAAVGHVGHGMTTATNAVIQRSGARIAFITNHGFRDLLEIGRQNRPRLYDLAVQRTPPLAERRDCHTVRGRLDHEGREIEPLDEAGLEAIAERLAADGIRAVAICLLHAWANPAHERRARDLLRARLPDAFVCISTDIIGEFREYERASTAALNAYLAPVMDRYLGSLEELLRAPDGLAAPAAAPVTVLEASGGLLTVAAARAKPVHTVLSGPAGGVVASARLAELCDIDRIITMDMGGTSTDISVILEHRPQVTSEASLEAIPIRIPVIDINAIGAGGGSIAWIDEGGALRVGPISAEAQPGPACYGRGGTRPTVTDANAVLGRLGGETQLGGDLGLDLEAAERAVREHVAEPLGLDPVAAAAGILRIAHASMERGIRVMSIERGHDPRDFCLVPFGGAGPMHGTPVARALGIPRLMIPPTPGILCALGILLSELRHNLVETRIMPLAGLAPEHLAAMLAPLAERGRALLAADGAAADERVIEPAVDLRYVGQSFELTIPVPPRGAAAGELAQAFHAAHRQTYGHADEAAPVELVNLRLVARAARPPLDLPRLAPGGPEPPAEAGTGKRRIFFETVGDWIETPVFRREALRAGNRIDGPAVIEELSATGVLYPGDRARVDASGALIIEVSGEGP